MKVKLYLYIMFDCKTRAIGIRIMDDLVTIEHKAYNIDMAFLNYRISIKINYSIVECNYLARLVLLYNFASQTPP